MKLVVFSVYDSKAEAFLQPFFSQSRGTGLRSFSDAAQDENHGFSRHAADYTLFELGEFDQISGRMDQWDAPINLGTALQYISEAPVTETVRQIGGSK